MRYLKRAQVLCSPSPLLCISKYLFLTKLPSNLAYRTVIRTHTHGCSRDCKSRDLSMFHLPPSCRNRKGICSDVTKNKGWFTASIVVQPMIFPLTIVFVRVFEVAVSATSSSLLNCRKCEMPQSRALPLVGPVLLTMTLMFGWPSSRCMATQARETRAIFVLVLEYTRMCYVYGHKLAIWQRARKPLGSSPTTLRCHRRTIFRPRF